MKLWDGRFNKPTNELVESFTASIVFDQRLWQRDILGSLAHIEALQQIGLITFEEFATMASGLKRVGEKIGKGWVNFSVQHEDIHMAVESLLRQEIGELAAKLHTGRSRNDQVALDLHLYLRDEVLLIMQKMSDLQLVLIDLAKQHIDTLMPGYTHLQRAQPIRLAHHLLAYVAMLQRDGERLMDSWPRINTMPLGAGALAGSGFNLNRDHVAKILQFDTIYDNSMDAVSDRDFVLEFLFDAALIMQHLSRLAEEVILWCTAEFNFIELDDAFCTGSSMMPQKKNPDVAELVRGKTGRVYGALMGLLTTLKALPLTYSKDLQEDKEGLFDTVDTLNNSLQLFCGLFASMRINVDKMRYAVQNDYATATALANYLSQKGVPFREAHAIVGKIVNHCIQQDLLLPQLKLDVYQQFSPFFADDIYLWLEPENVVESCQVKGGTAKSMVLQQLVTRAQMCQGIKAWVQTKQTLLNAINL